MAGTVNIYHADRIMAAIRSDEAAKSALVASWHRSSGLHRLDPAESKPPKRLTDAELNRARQSVELLIRTAQSSLDRLFLAVGGAAAALFWRTATAFPSSAEAPPATMRHSGIGGFGLAHYGAKKAKGRTALAPVSPSSEA